jgi:hypothetical protein
VSSRTARAIQRNPVSKNQKKKKKNKQTIFLNVIELGTVDEPLIPALRRHWQVEF